MNDTNHRERRITTIAAVFFGDLWDEAANRGPVFSNVWVDFPGSFPAWIRTTHIPKTRNFCVCWANQKFKTSKNTNKISKNHGKKPSFLRITLTLFVFLFP